MKYYDNFGKSLMHKVLCHDCINCFTTHIMKSRLWLIQEKLNKENQLIYNFKL